MSVPQEDQSSTANLELHQVNDSDSNSICLETAIWEPYIFPIVKIQLTKMMMHE